MIHPIRVVDGLCVRPSASSEPADSDPCAARQGIVEHRLHIPFLILTDVRNFEYKLTIRLEGFRGRVDQLDAWKEGLFQVQDEAAQVVSHILAPQPGERVLDLCAGLGGKTTHLARWIGERGRVIALDMSHRRLISLCQNIRRLGTDRIVPMVGDASRSLASLFRLPFDRVLVDAPCSGLGVLSRHPDGKWNRTEGDIIRLAGLQKKILSQAGSVVKRGGRILYVTCTLSREENEEVVAHFLEGHKPFRLEDIRDHIPPWGRPLTDGNGFLKTYPHRHGMDGFFAALLTSK